MKRNNTDMKAFLHFAVAKALPLIIFLSIMNLPKAKCLGTLDSTACSSGSSRNSSGCDTVINAEAEFLMDQSEITRRILATNTPISYGALNKGNGFCNAQVYGSCIGAGSGYYKKRGCSYKELCRS